jgi:hypothetical protein
MKPVKFTDYRPNKKAIAHDMWGEVNSTEKTTSKKASWFSCAGHGGYVCNPKDFSAEICKKLREPNYILKLLICEYGGIEYVCGVDYMHSKPKNFRVNGSYVFLEWRKYPMYVFEEDCNWAILTHFSGIQLKGHIDRGMKKEIAQLAYEIMEKYNPSYLTE